MRIDVVGRDVHITDNIREHAERKGAKLPKFFDGTQLITFTIAKEGSVDYSVECLVDVEKHDDFVSHGKDHSITAAIDSAVHKATRQLTDFKERLKSTR